MKYFISLVGIALLLFMFSPLVLTQQRDSVIARITISTPQELNNLIALGLDVLEMRDENDLFILTTGAKVKTLSAEGWKITVDQSQSMTLNTNTFGGGYRTVPEIRAFLVAQETQYPNLVENFTYGFSWEGNDLFGVKLTNKAITGPKPTFFLSAAIHPRELTTAELALRLVDYLTGRYATDGDIKWLLDEHLIVIVPAANPDGRMQVDNGESEKRKNTNPSYDGLGCFPYQIGVDLNRNFSYQWGVVDGPWHDHCAAVYPGPVAESELETRALENLWRSLFADQRGPLDTDAAPLNTTGISLTLHSYSRMTLWPWGWTATLAPNNADFALIGGKYASYNGTISGPSNTTIYPTSGTTDDWAYGELGIPAMTFEIGPLVGPCSGFFPPFNCLDEFAESNGAFWPRNLPAFLYAARIARQPYQLARGPSPEVVTIENFNLQAVFSEQYNGNQNIVAAEYYLDTPPWRGGVGVPMLPLDGTFDSPMEAATAVVSGTHQIYTRAQDSDGNWGPVMGAFINYCPTSMLPVSRSFGISGGDGSIAVTSSCAWSVTSNDNWITITSQGQGNGNDTITYEVRENFNPRVRVGTMTVAGMVFTVQQSGLDSNDCNIEIVPKFFTVTSTGGNGSFNVVASEECVWNAVSNSSWVITSSSGIGNGIVTFSVGVNSGPARKGTITVKNQTFNIKQKGL